MYNIVLYLLIIACSSLCGVLLALKYSGRVEHLSDFSEALRILETEMRYRKDPLPETFFRIGSYHNNSASAFFSYLSDMLKNNRSRAMAECWRQAVEDIYGGAGLKEEDMSVLKDVGIEMGRSDISGQASLFLRVQERLGDCIAEALAEKKTKGKMMKSMGVTIGIVIVIILI